MQERMSPEKRCCKTCWPREAAAERLLTFPARGTSELTAKIGRRRASGETTWELVVPVGRGFASGRTGCYLGDVRLLL